MYMYIVLRCTIYDQKDIKGKRDKMGIDNLFKHLVYLIGKACSEVGVKSLVGIVGTGGIS